MAAGDVSPELNPELDLSAIAEEFRSRGRVHIPNILTQDSALRLHRALVEETPWRLTLNKGQDFLDFASVTPEERNKIALGAWQRAQTQFQYLFENHRLSRDGEAYPDARHYFAKLVAFLNAPPFIAAMRQVTGLDAIARTDAQATLYRPGDFLTRHDDQYGGHKRLAAYVLNMTPNWRADWGGVLTFYDSRGHVAEGYVPTFNALNIFQVPVIHAVSQVAIFGGFRYSVTGWFHAK
jgi:SM-20-related protein